jgi:hypothetical protein
MSNNKQIHSVVWLSNQIYELFQQYEQGNIDRWTLRELMIKTTEQAKAMHKEEIKNAIVWFDDTDRRPHEIEIDAEQYYNETFGGNK